ncbi:hypothetical protein AA313_de0206117 [Arthrobotrys entomopaga]|nr:hypothetical protein AA313_de0206117 [Arthrobotrys entomopaga]
MCSTEKSVSSRLSSLISKLKPSKSSSSKLSAEQEELVKLHFSTSFRKIFTSSHLFKFLPIIPNYQETYDEAVARHLKKPSLYEDFGRVYESSKLGRCLVQLGMKEGFVTEYIKWKKDQSGDSSFDGCGWNEEWVYETGGAKGAVFDILGNF